MTTREARSFAPAARSSASPSIAGRCWSSSGRASSCTRSSRSRFRCRRVATCPRYLLVYAQLFDAHVVFPMAMLQRTPGTPLVVGTLLEAGPLVGRAWALRCSTPSRSSRGSASRGGTVRGGGRDGRRAARVPGLRAALPRARERRAVRGGVRARRPARRPCGGGADPRPLGGARSRGRRPRAHASGRSGTRAARSRPARGRAGALA